MHLLKMQDDDDSQTPLVDNGQPTQESTQSVTDPRRLGANRSDMTEEDASNVICILHPTTPLAYHSVARLAETNPDHILRNSGLLVDREADTFHGDNARGLAVPNTEHGAGKPTQSSPPVTHDIALRFNSKLINPVLGFVFGRYPPKSDIVLHEEQPHRILSNQHFRIFLTEHGILMIADTSTNGTMVDGVALCHRRDPQNASRMLKNGSDITITSKTGNEMKFIVRIPSRDGVEDEYDLNLGEYLTQVAMWEAAGLGAGPVKETAQVVSHTVQESGCGTS
jgi:FHA domain